jgi:hypothetical protein
MFFALIVVSFIGFAETPECSMAKAERAENATDGIHDWDSLHTWYREYRRCDDGSIAEGCSEQVARILVDHWSTLPHLLDLTVSNPNFRRFVLRHVNATQRLGDLKKIRDNASQRCPPGWQGMCNDLKSNANAAIQELAKYGITEP